MSINLERIKDLPNLQLLKFSTRLLILLKLLHKEKEDVEKKEINLVKDLLNFQLMRKERKKDIGKLCLTLDKLRDMEQLDSSTRDKIDKFFKKIEYPGTDKEVSWEYLKDKKIFLDSKQLPEWDNFYLYVFDYIESKFWRDRQVKNELVNILSIYNLKYDEMLNPDDFKPGKLIFNPNRHKQFRSSPSSYPHNSIIDVVKPGINTKEGTIIRKPLVVISFNI